MESRPDMNQQRQPQEVGGFLECSDYKKVNTLLKSGWTFHGLYIKRELLRPDDETVYVAELPVYILCEPPVAK